MKREFPFIYKIRNLQILKNQSFRRSRQKRLSKKFLRSKKIKIFLKKSLQFSLTKYLNFKIKKKSKKIVTLQSMNKPQTNNK